MPCFHPLTSYVGRELTAAGKQKRVFDRRKSLNGISTPLACGRCSGCRLEGARQWAIRCLHESSLHEENSFITLTYDEENLPRGESLQKIHFQKFIRKLRKKYPDEKIRYYHCGEYGGQFERPHYHAILFGFKFPDQEIWAKGITKQTKGGLPQQVTDSTYTSAILDEIWGKGLCQIGAVNLKSAAYIARYIMKKINGGLREKRDPETDLRHYDFVDVSTGEIIEQNPEYTTMSRRPGIGQGWYKKYKTDVYPNDSVIINGHEVKGPKYYDSLYEVENPDSMEAIKQRRVAGARTKQNRANTTPERLAVREKVAMARSNTPGSIGGGQYGRSRGATAADLTAQYRKENHG